MAYNDRFALSYSDRMALERAEFSARQARALSQDLKRQSAAMPPLIAFARKIATTSDMRMNVFELERLREEARSLLNEITGAS